MKHFSLPLISACAVFVACQTYDFAYIAPSSLSQTTQTRVIRPIVKKPNIMLLVDKSGSMGQPTSPSVPKPRIEVLRETMAQFLAANATTARVGVAFYPGGSNCGAPVKDLGIDLPASGVEDDATLRNAANAVIAKINTTPVTGGTPTAKSLDTVGSYSSLLDANDGRDDYILLLTDGLPNCNDANKPKICGKLGPNGTQALDSPECKSTAAQGNDWATRYCATPPTTTDNQCLDRDGLVEAIKVLRTKEIKTIVVGFGADTAGGAAAETLNAGALAGGFIRECPNSTDAECGSGNTCDKARKVCSTQFFQASSATELAATLTAIYSNVGKGDACVFKLDSQPSDPKLLAVLVNGANVPRGPDSWEYNGSEVRLIGKLCAEAKNPGAEKKTIELRVLERI